MNNLTQNHSNEEFTENVDELKSLVKTLVQAHKDQNEERKASSNFVNLVGVSSTIIVLFFGAAGGWYTNQASVKQLQESYMKLSNKVSKLEDTSHDIELKVVQESSDLISLKEDVREVKADVKEIKNRLFINE